MLVIISPSKTQECRGNRYQDFTIPEYLDRSCSLVDQLRKQTPAQIGALMQVSEKLAQLNWQRFHDFHVPFDLNNARQAILAFQGDAFSPMEVGNFSSHDVVFAQKYLRILSGLYGILRPLDLIQPYRLEMGLKFAPLAARNIYEFWSDLVTDSLNRDFQKDSQSQPVLLDLASEEYSKVLDRQKLQARVLKLSFKERKNGLYRVIAIHAKRARGMMVKYIITNKVTDVGKLQAFNLAGYRFQADQSSEEEWIFAR